MPLSFSRASMGGLPTLKAGPESSQGDPFSPTVPAALPWTSAQLCTAFWDVLNWKHVDKHSPRSASIHSGVWALVASGPQVP